jgi:hypothetical protein
MKLFRTTDDETTTGDEAVRDENEAVRDENGAMAMSQEPAQPVDDTRPAAPGLAREGDSADEPRPTFTPTSADSGVPSVRPDATEYGGDFTRPVSAVAPVDDEPVAVSPVDEPAAAFAADEHLLANTTGMRASWQKVQAEFVDAPQAAVMDAADLIEQTAQSLVDALQQRQRQLRDTVAGHSAGSDSAAANGVPDTEHLRLMMQRYRTLFNQLCDA